MARQGLKKNLPTLQAGVPQPLCALTSLSKLSPLPLPCPWAALPGSPPYPVPSVFDWFGDSFSEIPAGCPSPGPRAFKFYLVLKAQLNGAPPREEAQDPALMVIAPLPLSFLHRPLQHSHVWSGSLGHVPLFYKMGIPWRQGTTRHGPKVNGDPYRLWG